ncbi:hypothetical protein O7602_26410 [Micromonospora sp. WMMD1128]|uniref:hypothetical protein n=1 Tax=unclassified Micromonospora TaxID=2617518 RepID=UPI00248B8816|nr:MULTISPECIES: hypothetical protein [unclassified Micromonospora]WBB73182.1 hypothetical protein O7602_26410 [Micromonospora sp. WMMD1128]WFE33361.1 hypothetical protein O7613_28210 [Micromonospora sp. WMMD975]
MTTEPLRRRLLPAIALLLLAPWSSRTSVRVAGRGPGWAARGWPWPRCSGSAAAC